MPNSIDFYKRILLHVIPVRIIVPCLKVTKSKTRYKIILGSNIYAKLLFLHALEGWETTSSINGVGKSTVFSEKTFIKKHLQEAAL